MKSGILAVPGKLNYPWLIVTEPGLKAPACGVVGNSPACRGISRKTAQVA
jgi:hypothetical protein